MKPWERIEPTMVQKVGHRTIVTKTFIMSDGNTETFDIVWPEGTEFVHGIAVTPDNQVIVARMFRAGPEKVMDELPGGAVNKDETPEAAMRRELLEETGYKAGKVVYVGASHKDAWMNAIWHSFLLLDCAPATEQKLDPEEHIEVIKISIDKLIENARNDKMTDALAVFLAYDELTKLKAGNK
jgi:ADP-ribose pyrophosphatase